MKLLSVSLARLTVLTETSEFNPRNQVSVPDFVKAITGRYSFIKFPVTIEEFDLAKGITFSYGKIGSININEVVLYNAGTVIETGSATKDCEIVLSDLIQWVQELVGFEYTPIKEPRKFFLSELAISSDWNLDRLNRTFADLCSKVSALVSSYAQQPFRFETTSVFSLPDLSNIKIGPAAFRIDRLAGAPFEENKYYSAAPLPTDEHLELLAEFEKSLLS